MSAKLTQFITEWLRKNAIGRIAGADDIPHLVARCVREASEQGITRADLEAELGPLEECVRRALHRPADPRPHGSRTPRSPPPRPFRRR